MPSLYATAIFLFFHMFHSSTAQVRVNTTADKPLIIGVPSDSSVFVQKVLPAENTDVFPYTGFSVLVFEEAQKLLDYKIHYKFVEYQTNGTYDDLVARVGNKTLDAAVGDITILAKRWDLVEFTVPYAESELVMVVPVKRADAWIFLKPFSLGLWLATAGILLYTMSVIWFFEHRSNTDFRGSWKHQLGIALWFTFTSLFTAHRETVKNNHSRVVVIVWLFLVLIVMQSFTAGLSSLLTIQRLNSNVDLLRTKGATVGCNRFVKNFVQNKLGYMSENIKLMGPWDWEEYLDALKRGTISAALLENTYAKLLVNQDCKNYAITGSSYRFGGLGFAFQKESRLANDFSKAILTLSENGMLKRLENLWIPECSVDFNADLNGESLNFWNFWGLYLFSGSITTTSVLLFIVRLLKNYRPNQGIGINESVWRKIVRILRYLKNAELQGEEILP